MPVYSMTGYASAQAAGTAESPDSEGRTAPTRRLGLEIRSVNSRFLDLAFRLPDELRALEPALRTLLTQSVRRGKVEVRATLESTEAFAVPAPGEGFAAYFLYCATFSLVMDSNGTSFSVGAASTAVFSKVFPSSVER